MSLIFIKDVPKMMFFSSVIYHPEDNKCIKTLQVCFLDKIEDLEESTTFTTLVGPAQNINYQVIFHFLENRNVSANSEKEGWPLTWRIAMQYFSGVFGHGQLTSLLPGGRASWSSPPGALPPSAPARPPAIRWQFQLYQDNARPWQCHSGAVAITFVDWSPPPPWR